MQEVLSPHSRHAMDTLARRYQTRLRFLVRRRIGDDLRRHVESMDVVQETFAQAMQSIDTLEVRCEDSVLHWLGKIALHVIYGYRTHYRAMKRDSTRDRPFEDGVAQRGDGPGTILVGREELDELRCAVSRLSPTERALIELRQREGLPWSAVAERTGYASGDSARMCFRRLKRELRRGVGVG